MTYREKLQQEHPECVSDCYAGGCKSCPKTYGYGPEDGATRETCIARQKFMWISKELCRQCWDREIPEEEPAATETNVDVDDVLEALQRLHENAHMTTLTASEPIAMERPKAEEPINELIELKPCPFCGGKAAIGYGQSEYDDVISISVLCQTCRIGIFQYRTDPNKVYDGFKTGQEAVDAWNRRADHD